ncbi:MAG: 30S ribosomal protein S20 [Bryobacteraceae bacterium]
MANHVSALKRVRIAERRTVINRLRKTRMRVQVKKMRKLLAANESGPAQEALAATYSIIDRSAKWGIIKKNTAARYKSRLVARLKKISEPKAA